MDLDLKFLPLKDKCVLTTAMKCEKTETSLTSWSVWRNLLKLIDRDVSFIYNKLYQSWTYRSQGLIFEIDFKKTLFLFSFHFTVHNLGHKSFCSLLSSVTGSSMGQSPKKCLHAASQTVLPGPMWSCLPFLFPPASVPSRWPGTHAARVYGLYVQEFVVWLQLTIIFLLSIV